MVVVEGFEFVFANISTSSPGFNNMFFLKVEI